MRLLSQHQSILAFHDIDFGGDATGINGCSPTDVMHSMKLGILRYVAKWVMDWIKPAQKSIIDGVAHLVVCRQRQTESRYYPRTNFSHGITGVSMLTADEWVGVVMTTAILLQTTQGRKAFISSKPCLPNGTDVDDVVNILEMLIACLTWLSAGPFWNRTSGGEGQKVATRSIDVLVATLVNIAPRTDGNGWCIIKLHDLRHICHQIAKFGSPSNWDSCTGERNLKEHAKKPAKTAQMRGYKTFLEQTLKRSVERSAISMAAEDWRLDRWKEWNDGDLDQLYHGRSDRNTVSTGLITRQWDDGSLDTMRIKILQFSVYVHSNTATSRRGAITFTGKTILSPASAVLDAITSHVTEEVLTLLDIASTVEDGSENVTDRVVEADVAIYSEAVLSSFSRGSREPPMGLDRRRYNHIKENGLSIRCHPNYGSDGAWHDWVAINNDAGTKWSVSKLLAIFVWSVPGYDEHLHPNVVVHPSTEIFDSTVLIERRKLAYSCKVVEDEKGKKTNSISLSSQYIRPTRYQLGYTHLPKH